MKVLKQLKETVLEGKLLNREDILELVNMPLESLCEAADEIRKQFCGNKFDICTIINGKSGRCSENCKYCAQSINHKTNIEEYTLLDSENIVEQAKYNEERGVLRYSIVTSGKKLSNGEVDKICKTVKKIQKETSIVICGSFGLLDETQFRKVKEAGISRVHNNLETSEGYFKNVCTTHSFQDKVNAIKAAQRVGLNVCSGGIMGMGETMEDRIDMVLQIRRLGVRSIPVNLLNPIKGTPYEGKSRLSNNEMCRIVALFRFSVPDASIRLAGGRELLEDKGKKCFQSGANAAITGDMLTTEGISIADDMKMLEELGYEPALWNE